MGWFLQANPFSFFPIITGRHTSFGVDSILPFPFFSVHHHLSQTRGTYILVKPRRQCRPSPCFNAPRQNESLSPSASSQRSPSPTNARSSHGFTLRSFSEALRWACSTLEIKLARLVRQCSRLSVSIPKFRSWGQGSACPVPALRVQFQVV